MRRGGLHAFILRGLRAQGLMRADSERRSGQQQRGGCGISVTHFRYSSQQSSDQWLVQKTPGKWQKSHERSLNEPLVGWDMVTISNAP